jgi:hypothetical protein
MKTINQEIYPKTIFTAITLAVVLLFAGMANFAFASTEDPVSGTMSVSSTSVEVGEAITISITGQDDNNLISLSLYHHGQWHEVPVSGISATRTWTLTESSPGTYRYNGWVSGNIESGIPDWYLWMTKNEEGAYTSPAYVEVLVSEKSYTEPVPAPTCYDQCSYSGQTRCYDGERKQVCGQHDSDPCLEWSHSISCAGSTSCGYGTCDNDEKPDWYCSNGNCVYTCNYNSDCVKSCECTSGVCCDGCNYRPSTWICDTETETQYGCPWGTTCGADVAEKSKTRYRYCSGTSSQCSGNWDDWLPLTAWKTSDYCSSSEICVVGASQCQASSTCSSSNVKYIKGCYDNDVYWFDTDNVRYSKVQECDDDNPCTLDSCEEGVCVNELKQDGTTCEIGSPEYCENCEHCGDGLCNCGEDNTNCPDDCGIKDGEAEVGTWLQSFLKKWYVWLILGIVAIMLLYWLFKRPKE